MIKNIALYLPPLFLLSCANPITPTGGEKDTIPPNLVNTIPAIGQKNFSDDKVILYFDEYIEASQLKSELIIVPDYELKYKSKTKKNSLTILLESDLNTNTTYYFNFLNSVKDITEKLPAKNLILAFSTGKDIDTLSVSGVVSDIYTSKPDPDFFVGLYMPSDTLDFLKHKPKYFIKTNDAGHFSLLYIKKDVYILFGFEDINKNLLFDPDVEKHAYFSDTVFVDSTIQQLKLNALNLNPILPRVISKRTSEQYYDCRINKKITSVDISNTQDLKLDYQLNEDKKSIRIYKNQFITDSLRTELTLYDSIGNIKIDTVYVKFNKQRKRPDAFTCEIKTLSAKKNIISVLYNCNKPIEIGRVSRINISADTLLRFDTDTTFYEITYNKYQTNMKISFVWDWIQSNTLVESTIDSLVNDSIVFSQGPHLNKLLFTIKDSIIVSVEGDSLKTSPVLINRPNGTELGSIKLQIKNIFHDSYFLEIIDENYQSIYRYYKPVEIMINDLKPNKYTFRLLVDENNDSLWTFGNLYKQIKPEKTLVCDQFTELRANWQNEIALDLENMLMESK